MGCARQMKTSQPSFGEAKKKQNATKSHKIDTLDRRNV